MVFPVEKTTVSMPGLSSETSHSWKKTNVEVRSLLEMAQAPSEWSSSRPPSDISPLHKPFTFPSCSCLTEVGSFEKDVLPYQSANSGKLYRSSRSS